MNLDISLSPADSLDIGSSEERAGFGTVKIETDDALLTEGVDQHIGKHREGPLVSGYHLAEWLAWNWWRLRWEWWHPRNASEDVMDDWDFAHRLSTIGEGYEWPNMTVASDGFQSAIITEPSIDHASFRYSGAPMTLISADVMEAAVDRFVSDIVALMDKKELRETNLHRLWSELQIERQDPETASLRRLEARLGYDPDEADHLGEEWRDDAARLGGDSLEELAADAAYLCKPNDMMSASCITEMANSCGFEASGQDSIVPWERSQEEWGIWEAWRIGESYARRLRMEERIDVVDPVSNGRLAELAGVSKKAISRSDCIGDISFFLNRDLGTSARMVFRSKWENGRRFALARIIGDRLFAWTDKMFPATRSFTYRQKAQRAFAAEFLSPFVGVRDMLGTDDSEDRQNEIAEHYQVSSITIKTILVNKAIIGRDDSSGIVHRSPFADQFSNPLRQVHGDRSAFASDVRSQVWTSSAIAVRRSGQP